MQALYVSNWCTHVVRIFFLLSLALAKTTRIHTNQPSRRKEGAIQSLRDTNTATFYARSRERKRDAERARMVISIHCRQWTIGSVAGCRHFEQYHLMMKTRKSFGSTCIYVYNIFKLYFTRLVYGFSMFFFHLLSISKLIFDSNSSSLARILMRK